MGKSTHFSGQPLYCQVIKLLDKATILRLSREYGGERYVKRFDVWTHLVVMLYAVIMRFDSLREIMSSLQAESRKLCHLGIRLMPSRSTLSDANRRRPEIIFESIYRDLYTTYRNVLSTDSRKNRDAVWMKRLQIIDSTTITLFSNLLFKGVGRHPKNGKKKGGIKVHTVINADETVPGLVWFSEAKKHDHEFLDKLKCDKNTVYVFDKGYNDYKTFEHFTEQETGFVTRIKDNASYINIEALDLGEHIHSGVLKDEIIEIEVKKGQQTKPLRLRKVVFYDRANKREFEFLTNLFDMRADLIAALYKIRWQIELLFKQLKQNFPLKYFLGDNENAIKIQIYCVLIVNLLLTVIKKRLKRHWAFSNLVSFCKIHLFNYINLMKFLENPEKDWIIDRDDGKQLAFNW